MLWRHLVGVAKSAKLSQGKISQTFGQGGPFLCTTFIAAVFGHARSAIISLSTLDVRKELICFEREDGKSTPCQR